MTNKLCGGHITKVYFSKGYSDEHLIISTDMEGFFGQFEVSLDDLVDYFNDHQEKEQCKCCKEFFFRQQIETNSGLCSCNWLEKCDTNHCDPQSPHREDHPQIPLPGGEK